MESLAISDYKKGGQGYLAGRNTSGKALTCLVDDKTEGRTYSCEEVCIPIKVDPSVHSTSHDVPHLEQVRFDEKICHP
jgi:hypothetical protein